MLKRHRWAIVGAVLTGLVLPAAVPATTSAQEAPEPTTVKPDLPDVPVVESTTGSYVVVMADDPLLAALSQDLGPDCLITTNGYKDDAFIKLALNGLRMGKTVVLILEKLSELEREGFAVFGFKDVVDPLKADVRRRWAAFLDQSQGETVPQGGEEEGRSGVRLVPPDQRVEERQLFRWLVDCVLTALKHLDTGEKTRKYLLTLWQFIRLQAAEEALAAPGSRLGQLLREAEDHERPSLRSLAEQLRIPRERLPGLYETLGSLFESCRAANSGRAAVKSLSKQSLQDRRGESNAH
jgi:hypothetical protein